MDTIVEQMEKAHENRRRYIKNWSTHQRAAARRRSELKKEEQARLALAMTGG